MSKVFNPHQPIRPLYHPETGEFLLHRTFPLIKNVRFPKIMTTKYQIAQMRLYRSLRQGEYPNNAAVAEIYDWLFFDKLTSKNAIGSVILQALRYEARKQFNTSKFGTNRIVYHFNNLLEFEYGLEWQICTWLRKFLQERDALTKPPYSGPDGAEDALTHLGLCDDREYIRQYEAPIREAQIAFMFDDLQRVKNWEALCEGLVEADIPIENEPRFVKGARPKPLF